MKKPAVAGSRTQDTSGLSRQCSATEPQQPDDHQPSQSSMYTAQMVLNASVTHLAATCRESNQYTAQMVLNASVAHLAATCRESEPVYIEDCEGWWLSGCCSSVAEHWWLKPEVSWVRLPVTAGFFHFPLFSPHNI